MLFFFTDKEGRLARAISKPTIQCHLKTSPIITPKTIIPSDTSSTINTNEFPISTQTTPSATITSSASLPISSVNTVSLKSHFDTAFFCYIKTIFNIFPLAIQMQLKREIFKIFLTTELQFFLNP